MRRERRTPLPFDLYAAGMLVTLIGLWVAKPHLHPRLFLFSLVMVFLGTLASLEFRRRRWKRGYISWSIGIAFSLTFLLSLLLRGPQRWLWEGSLDWLITWVVLVVAFRSWGLLNDLDVVLSILPTMSLFILVSISDDRPLLFLSVFPYGLASLFLAMRYYRKVLEAQVDQVFHTHTEREEKVQDLWMLGSVGVLVGLAALLVSRLLAGLEMPRQWVEQYGSLVASRLADYLLALSQRQLHLMDTSLSVGQSFGSESSRPLFLVRAPHGTLWRAQTLSYYDGHTWWAEEPGKRRERWVPLLPDPLSREGGYSVPLEEGEPPQVPGYWFPQRFVFLVDQAGAFLYAHRLHRLQVPFGTVRKLRGAIVHSYPLKAREGYRALSWVKRLYPSTLRRATGSIPSAMKERYLQLPPMPERVVTLTHHLARGAKTPYEKVERFLRFLGESHVYNRRTPRIPEGRDAVDYFLFEMEEGFCQHFASALAVMCRIAGIPSRVVTGFAGGEFQPDSQAYLVREKDAHAWVDVYLPGLGWVEVDPTVSVVSKPPLWERWANWASKTWKEVLAWALRLWQGRFPWKLALLGMGSLLLPAMFWLWRRKARPREGSLFFSLGPLPPSRRRIAGLYQQGMRWLARYGLERGPAETALEFAQRVATQNPPLGQAWLALTHLYLKGIYGPFPLSWREHQKALEWLQETRRLLSHLPRP